MKNKQKSFFSFIPGKIKKCILIIAKNHRDAKTAKNIWTVKHKFSIDAKLNIISIKKTFHKHIHTKLYFAAITLMITTGDVTFGKYGVVAALCITRVVIAAANKLVV